MRFKDAKGWENPNNNNNNNCRSHFGLLILKYL